MIFLGRRWISPKGYKLYYKLVIVFLLFTSICLTINIYSQRTSSPAVYLRPTGGLGNQLFQYACAYTIARKNNWPLYVQIPPNNTQSRFRPQDRDFTLNYFNISFNPNKSDSDGSLLVIYHNFFTLDDLTILSETYPVSHNMIFRYKCQKILQ